MQFVTIVGVILPLPAFVLLFFLRSDYWLLDFITAEEIVNVTAFSKLSLSIKSRKNLFIDFIRGIISDSCFSTAEFLSADFDLSGEFSGVMFFSSLLFDFII